MSQATHAVRAPQRPLATGVRAYLHVNRLLERASVEGRPALEVFRYTRALERRAPERLAALVSHLRQALNTSPDRTLPFSAEELRAAVLGRV